VFVGCICRFFVRFLDSQSVFHALLGVHARFPALIFSFGSSLCFASSSLLSSPFFSLLFSFYSLSLSLFLFPFSLPLSH
jgi:hypothetical protein